MGILTVRRRSGNTWANSPVQYMDDRQRVLPATIRLRDNNTWEPAVPPVQPGVGTPIAALSDISSVWVAGKHLAPGNTPHFHTITTPNGPGWEMICDDSDVTVWDSNCRATLARKDPTANNIGRTDVYTWDWYLPKQQIYNIWHTGLLIEWHTETSSGHTIALDYGGGTPKFRIARNLNNYKYEYLPGPNVVWDQWIPVCVKIKWSTGSDGILQVDIGGKRYVDFKGATAYAGDTVPYMQFGWYARRPHGLTNVVRFGNMRVQRT